MRLNILISLAIAAIAAQEEFKGSDQGVSGLEADNSQLGYGSSTGNTPSTGETGQTQPSKDEYGDEEELEQPSDESSTTNETQDDSPAVTSPIPDLTSAEIVTNNSTGYGTTTELGVDSVANVTDTQVGLESPVLGSEGSSGNSSTTDIPVSPEVPIGTNMTVAQPSYPGANPSSELPGNLQLTPDTNSKCPNLYADTCYHGHQLDVPPATNSLFPRCWLWAKPSCNGDKCHEPVWGCYHAINNKCEWDNMIDITSPTNNCQTYVEEVPNAIEGKFPAYRPRKKRVCRARPHLTPGTNVAPPAPEPVSPQTYDTQPPVGSTGGDTANPLAYDMRAPTDSAYSSSGDGTTGGPALDQLASADLDTTKLELIQPEASALEESKPEEPQQDQPQPEESKIEEAPAKEESKPEENKSKEPKSEEAPAQEEIEQVDIPAPVLEAKESDADASAYSG